MALWKEHISALHTPVKAAGKKTRITVCPFKEERVTGFLAVSRSVKSGAGVPTDNAIECSMKKWCSNWDCKPTNGGEHVLTSGSSANVFQGKFMGFSYGDNDLVTVKSCNTAVDAHVLMGLLRDNGVESFLADEAHMSWQPYATYALGGVKVQVRGGDVEKALEILASPLDGEAGQEVDDETPGFDLKCPQCGSRMVHRKSSFNFFLFLMALSGFGVRQKSSNTMVCEVCDHRWEQE
jgi:hypothetical protein